jgi:hypothetical protein
MGRFRFGPLGRLMVVDTPQDGFDDPTEEIGAISQSLNGTRTKDVFGYRAAYKIKLDGLTPRALSWFAMAYRGALGSPLYFLDEQRINRMTAAASSTLSAKGESDPFTHTNGTHTTVANTSLLLPGTEDGAAVSTPGPALALQWASTGTQRILRCGPAIPVQLGEHVVFSFYRLTSSLDSQTPQGEFTPYDTAGVALPQSGVQGSIAGAPNRHYVRYTVPAGVASVQPCIRHGLAHTSSFVGLQFEEGDDPTPWVIGGGGLQVLVDDMPTTRRWLGNHKDLSISLLEV